MQDIDEMYEAFLASAANHFVSEDILREEKEKQFLPEEGWIDIDLYPECCCW